MVPFRKFAGLLLAACTAATLLAGCTSGSGGKRAAEERAKQPWVNGGELSWSAPEQGPKRPAAGKAAAPRKGSEGDLNGDGYDDFAAYDEDRIRIVYGSRDGLDPRTRTTVRAASQRTPTVNVGVLRLVRTDLDHDGYTDLVADFYGGRALALWSGPRGIGKVTELPGTGLVQAGDFDGDGKADLFRLGTLGGPEGTVAYGPVGRDGEGVRRQTLNRPLPEDHAPHAATAGDFDGDGRTDLAVRMRLIDPEGDGDLIYTQIHYYQGSGTGLAHDPARSGDETDRGRGLPADVDGDGTDDVTRVSVRARDRELHITTQWGDAPDGRTTVLTGLPGMDNELLDYGGTAGLAIGDVTGDGKPDLVVSASSANENQGVLFLLRDMARPATRNLQAVDLQSPGVPGKDRPNARNRFAPVPPLLDVDGDGHLDAIATAGKLRGYWTLPGTDAGLDTRATRRITQEELD